MACGNETNLQLQLLMTSSTAPKITVSLSFLTSSIHSFGGYVLNASGNKASFDKANWCLAISISRPAGHVGFFSRQHGTGTGFLKRCLMLCFCLPNFKTFSVCSWFHRHKNGVNSPLTTGQGIKIAFLILKTHL
uniref:Uncharacterized protein n=1 Tax=Salix viminalis TaxID=40686 RepID=A0A6N2LHI2_SALVM